MTHDFEWDDAKAAANFRKHGVDFETATDVFRDPFAVDVVDASMDYGEPRFRIIGRAGGKLVTVVFTERGDRIRIISARQATRREYDGYHQQNS
jgi:uncharacterized DUF497 family protein